MKYKQVTFVRNIMTDARKLPCIDYRRVHEYATKFINDERSETLIFTRFQALYSDKKQA